MEKAVPGNLAIRQAAARLKQAEAEAVKAGAARWPELNLSASASRTETRSESGVRVPGAVNGESAAAAQTSTTEERYQVGPAASYEIDLWGRIAALDRAAMNNYKATRSDTLSAYLSISARQVETWYRWNGLKTRLELLGEQERTSSNNLELVRLRYRRGLAEAPAVWNQTEQLAALRATRPTLEANLSRAARMLAVLAGKTPDKAPDDSAGLVPAPPLPATGVPADLLENRPDVAAALLRVEAADEQVAAAIANRLPSLRISGEARYTSDSASTILDNWLWSITGSLLTPVFDAGRRRAEVARSKASRTEWYARFRETLLEALKDVEDALSRNSAAARSLQRRTERLNSARMVYRRTKQRYLKGVADYLDVVRALERYQSAQREHLGAREELLLARVELYRAIGGGNISKIRERTRNE
jgi:NodT family efflux transporter outer membrane factor (OMF) lipoprotein